MREHKFFRLCLTFSLSFSVVFACDEETKTTLRKKFLKFISEAEALCEKAPREKLCQINFDLHDWA